MKTMKLKPVAFEKSDASFIYLVQRPAGYEECTFILYPPRDITDYTARMANPGVVMPDNDLFKVTYDMDMSIGRPSNTCYSMGDYVVNVLVFNEHDPLFMDSEEDEDVVSEPIGATEA